MANNVGPVAGGPISPLTDQDQYGIGNDTYFVGGYRVVVLITDRNAITVPRRKVGMAVKVLEDGIVYELEEDLVTWVAQTAPPSGSAVPRSFEQAVNGLVYDLILTPDQTKPMRLYMGGYRQPPGSFSVATHILTLGDGFGPIIGEYDNIAFDYFTTV